MIIGISYFIQVESKLFKSITSNSFAEGANPIQYNYGVAVSDVDGDGDFEFIGKSDFQFKISPLDGNYNFEYSLTSGGQFVNRFKILFLFPLVAGYGTNRGAGAPNLVLSYNKLTKKLENLAIDDPNSPYYHIRNDKGKAIGVAGKIH